MTLLDLYKPIRKFSYVLITIGAVFLSAYFTILTDFSLAGLVFVAAVAAALAGNWRLLRPGPADLKTISEVEAAIGAGRPTFLNVYSNY